MNVFLIRLKNLLAISVRKSAEKTVDFLTRFLEKLMISDINAVTFLLNPCMKHL